MADFDSFPITYNATTSYVYGGTSLGYYPNGRTVFQRVYDTVNTVWCYYTYQTVEPNPVQAITIPPHSGSITSHQVLVSDL